MNRLLLLLLIAVLACVSHAAAAADVPVQGRGRKLPAFDEVLLEHLEKSRCTAATLALMKNGRVVYSRGYGWLDLARTRPAPPDTPMRVASISKPITSAAVHKLFAAGQLAAEAQVWPILKIDPPQPDKLDPRWQQITIGELLAHKGGWDIKELGFDPMFNGPRAARELELDHPAGPEDMVRWMMSYPLQFDPGEREAYSNFGYCILGRVIERVARRPYIVYVQQEICRPAGVSPKAAWLGRTDPDQRDPREPEYNEPCNVDIMDAHGGIVISSPNLCKFLQGYWISGKSRQPGQRGYVYTFYGSMPGTSAIAHQRADGTNFTCAFNGRHGDASLDELTARINRLVDEMPR